MPYTYKYPRAALTVDCVVYGFDGGELKVLLIQRGLEPFKGRWALPGGFVRLDETLDEAARGALRGGWADQRVSWSSFTLSAPWTAIHVSGS